jgi:hypothetical protein
LGWEHATPEEGTQRLLINTSKREEGREGCAKIKGSRGEEREERGRERGGLLCKDAQNGDEEEEEKKGERGREERQ